MANLDDTSGSTISGAQPAWGVVELAELTLLPASPVPTATTAKKTDASSASSSTGETENPVQIYTVVRGDTLSAIAARYNLHWRDLFELNRDTIQNANLIYPGQELKIPSKSKKTVAQTAPARSTHPNSASQQPQPESGGGATDRYHTVQPGETLTGIVRRYGHVEVDDIFQANRAVLFSPNALAVGTRLLVPATMLPEDSWSARLPAGYTVVVGNSYGLTLEYHASLQAEPVTITTYSPLEMVGMPSALEDLAKTLQIFAKQNVTVTGVSLWLNKWGLFDCAVILTPYGKFVSRDVMNPDDLALNLQKLRLNGGLSSVTQLNEHDTWVTHELSNSYTWVSVHEQGEIHYIYDKTKLGIPKESRMSVYFEFNPKFSPSQWPDLPTSGPIDSDMLSANYVTSLNAVASWLDNHLFTLNDEELTSLRYIRVTPPLQNPSGSQQFQIVFLDGSKEQIGESAILTISNSSEYYLTAVSAL